MGEKLVLRIGYFLGCNFGGLIFGVYLFGLVWYFSWGNHVGRVISIEVILYDMGFNFVGVRGLSSTGYNVSSVFKMRLSTSCAVFTL